MQNPSYELRLKSKTDRGKEIYEFVSADGVASKDSFREAELALADNVEPEVDDDVLVVQGGYGFLGVILADQAQYGETLVAETSDRAYQLAKQNLKQNNIQNASCRKVSSYSEIDQSFDKVVYAPKGYEPVEVVNNRISNSIQLLEQKGELLVAGKKTDGINRYKSQLNSMPGNTEKIAQDGKQRVYRYTKTEEFEPEKFEKQASEASLQFIESFEDLQDMRDGFEDTVLEFRGPASGVHWHEVTSLAKSSDAVEMYGDLTLELMLPEDSTYPINGHRVPGVIPMEFVDTVYGPKETVEALEEDFDNEYGIEYSELSSI